MEQAATGEDDVKTETESFVDSRAVARYLGLSLNFIGDLARRGDLPSYSFGNGKGRRFLLSEVREWAASKRHAVDHNGAG